MNFKYVVALTHVFFSVCLFDRCLNNKVLPRLICFVLLITPTYFFLYIRIDHVTCRIVILHYPLRAKNILDSANFLSWFVKKMIYLRLFLHRGLEISSINHIKCLWSHSSLFASDIQSHSSCLTNIFSLSFLPTSAKISTYQNIFLRLKISIFFKKSVDIIISMRIQKDQLSVLFQLILRCKTSTAINTLYLTWRIEQLPLKKKS